MARRSHVGVVLLLAVAAQTRGSFHLTMNTNGAIETAHAFQDAMIVPFIMRAAQIFTQSRGDLEQAFSTLGFGSRLRLLEVGVRSGNRVLGTTLRYREGVCVTCSHSALSPTLPCPPPLVSHPPTPARTARETACR